MIKEDYVSFETAKLLKEKGFNERTNMPHIDDYQRLVCYIPTLQMAMKWLRKVHNICISVDVKIGGGKYYVCISSTENGLSYGVLEDEVWDTFEEACEESIKYCLENLL
jgi:hypothetical protein